MTVLKRLGWAALIICALLGFALILLCLTDGVAGAEGTDAILAWLGDMPWRSIIIKLAFLAIVAEGMLVYTRRADKRAGFHFKELFNAMRADPRALADYLGKRWLGFCILAAACVLIS